MSVKNKGLILLLAAALLSGCSGTMRKSIPVVESGTPVTPGVLRDKHARQQGATVVDRTDAPVAYGAPESEYVKPETAYIPSAPIQADEFDEFVPADEDMGVAASTPSVTAPVTPTAPAPIAAERQASAAPAQIDPPVLALLSTAQHQQRQGDLNGASSSLERAQRIAPREPQVLYRLAELRLMQGNAQQAEQLAQRGLSLSTGRPALQAGLWDLIAEAREVRGDAAGAEQARQRARVQL